MIQKNTLTGLLLAFTITSGHAAENLNTIGIRAGSFSLSNTNETVLGTNITLTEDSDSPFSIEYMRNMNGYRLGGEFISFSNDYSVAGSRGTIDTMYIMFNIDKRFDATSWLKPYIGVGIGAVAIDVTGPIIGNAGGVAFGFRAGLDIPFSSNIGLVVEYKGLSGKPEDSAGEDVDVSGSGAFAGLNIYF